MHTRSIISALALLVLAVDAGQDRLVEPPKEETWDPPAYTPSRRSHSAWGPEPTSLEKKELSARASISAPIRLPLPAGGEPAARRMYAARKDHMIMVGDIFLEELEFRVDAGSVHVAHKPGGSRFVIGQHAGAGLYLIKGNGMAVDMGDPELAEGTIAAGYLLDDGLYSYTTVLGAPRQISKARMATPRPATFEEFMAAAKDGYSFKTTVVRKVKCTGCYGSRIIQPKSQADMGQRKLCTECGGQGMVSATVAAEMMGGPPGVPVTGSR